MKSKKRYKELTYVCKMEPRIMDDRWMTSLFQDRNEEFKRKRRLKKERDLNADITPELINEISLLEECNSTLKRRIEELEDYKEFQIKQYEKENKYYKTYFDT